MQGAFDELRADLQTSEAQLAATQAKLAQAEQQFAVQSACAEQRIAELEHSLHDAESQLRSTAKSIAASVGHKRKAADRTDASIASLEAKVQRAHVRDSLSRTPFVLRVTGGSSASHWVHSA